MAVERTFICLGKRFYFIYCFNLSFYFIYFLYSHLLFFEYCFLLLSSFLFIYFYYESVDLFGKKGILLIDTFKMYPRMLRVDEICKHSYMFSNPSIQSGCECFVITGMVNSCYGPYSLLFIFYMLV